MSVFLNAALDDGPVASPPAPAPALVPAPDVLADPPGHLGPRSASDPGRPVREFQAICAKHSLACGAPDDLTAFLRALDQNKLLAMNFWSVVARLSAGKDGAALTQQQTLAAIVQAVAGQPIEQVREAGEAQQKHIDQLARILSGEDVPLTPTQTAPPSSQPAAAQPEPLAPQPHDAQSPDPPSAPRSSITQLHLAAAAPAAAPPETEVLPPDESAPMAPSTARPRLVLQPDHPRHLEPAAGASVVPGAQPEAPRGAPRAPAGARTPLHIEPEDEPRIAIPLSAYAERDDKNAFARRAGIVALGLALLCGFVFLIARTVAAWRQPGNQARAGISSLTHRLTGFVHPSAATPNAAPPATTGPLSNPAPAPAPPQAAAPAPQTVPSAPNGVSSESSSRSRTQRTGRSADSDNSAALADDSALVQVSAAAMRDHLISSRFPIVPDAANADALTDVVTLHAVITARGTVEHAYAISGPDNLRQPALDAVAGWRYRPYLLNGTPVDVSTTIRVDFSGND